MTHRCRSRAMAVPIGLPRPRHGPTVQALEVLHSTRVCVPPRNFYQPLWYHESVLPRAIRILLVTAVNEGWRAGSKALANCLMILEALVMENRKRLG